MTALLSVTSYLALPALSSLQTTTSALTLTASVASTITHFCNQLFLHPGNHTTVITLLVVTVVALPVGTAFLIKKVYAKCMAQKSITP